MMMAIIQAGTCICSSGRGSRVGRPSQLSSPPSRRLAAGWSPFASDTQTQCSRTFPPHARSRVSPLSRLSSLVGPPRCPQASAPFSSPSPSSTTAAILTAAAAAAAAAVAAVVKANGYRRLSTLMRRLPSVRLRRATRGLRAPRPMAQTRFERACGPPPPESLDPCSLDPAPPSPSHQPRCHPQPSG